MQLTRFVHMYSHTQALCGDWTFKNMSSKNPQGFPLDTPENRSPITRQDVCPTEAPTPVTTAPTPLPFETPAPTPLPSDTPAPTPFSSPTTAPTAGAAGTSAPTGSPTQAATTAPTAFPASPLYDRVTTDFHCADANTVATAAPLGRARELAADDSAKSAGGMERVLAGTTPVEACYQACYSFYSPAPNNAQFIFQLVDVEGTRECQCCKTCDTLLPLAGALVMEACVPNAVLSIGAKASRRFLKAKGTKPLAVTFTLRVKGRAKRLRLRDMGVQVTVPTGATVVGVRSSGHRRAGQPTVEGRVVTFYPLTFVGTKSQAFRVKVVLRPPFDSNADVRFQAQVFQNAYNLAPAPYCPLPARDVVLSAKYP